MACSTGPASPSGRLTRRCSEPHHHKVLGRGRLSLLRGLLPRARVLNGRRAVAELGS
jgi:hypothetical protein